MAANIKFFRGRYYFGGDPSGKDSTRKILTHKKIKKNIQSIKKVFKNILKTENKKTKPIFVDNADWLTELNYIEFLRNIGSLLL